MWQITWMLSLLPNWFWTLVLIIGLLAVLATWLLKFIPVISTYRLPIQIGGILALLIGVYFQGVIANEEKYKNEHARLETLVKKQESEFKAINDELIVIKHERDRAIAKQGKTIIKTIDHYVKADTVTIVQEIVKEKNLSDEERRKLEVQIEELKRAERECKIPSLIIEQLNNSARPVKESK